MTRYIVGTMIALIVVAHVFMWRSAMPLEQKIVFTLLNTAGWGIVFAPIFLVGRWLRSVEARNRAEAARGDSDTPAP